MVDTKKANQQFRIERIYVKSSSFDLKDAPSVFYKTGTPENKMELSIQRKKLSGDHLYEVVLGIKVTTVLKDKAEKQEEAKEFKIDPKKAIKETEVFEVHVKEAGIFHIEGFEKEPQDRLLGIYCPEVLYPYARHVVAELVVMSGLPPVALVPMNFEMIYAQEKAERQKQATTTAAGSDGKIVH